MDESFKIWVDRLKEGQVQKIVDSLDPAFLEVQEKELRFESPVILKGEAYVSSDELILCLNAKTWATMPCAICNKMVPTELKIENFYHAEPLQEIPSAIFDFREALREALLIELPKYIECSGGKCPERSSITPYCAREARTKQPTYLPFSGL